MNIKTFNIPCTAEIADGMIDFIQEIGELCQSLTVVQIPVGVVLQLRIGGDWAVYNEGSRVEHPLEELAYKTTGTNASKNLVLVAATTKTIIIISSNKIARYASSPTDLTDGDLAFLLTDIKGSHRVRQRQYATFKTGTKAVAAAGTAVALVASSTPVPDGAEVVVKAKRANTGYIYVGESAAQAQAHTFELSASDAIGLRVDNLADIFIDSSVNGEGVEYLVEQDA